MEEKGKTRGRGVVLLVEDDPHDAMLVERSFRRGNLMVSLVVVRDGREALDYLLGKGKFSSGEVLCLPRLILLDLKLPRMNGFEFLKEVKNTPSLSRIPVVVLTSSLEWKDVDKAYELGASAYLVKPVKFEEFMEMMKVVGTFWVSFNVTSASNFTY
ncbi:MAG TPA: response regulator [Thermosulfidibacter takaii]|uniref:Response regulator n=1 Tax=Thermosulfidibacter takaii TaxID=412593 RepID=A0A7C0U7B8_9BACT|nr:response regulator [Thermosulfidibacter takaii]